jgi:hypothetical protein
MQLSCFRKIAHFQKENKMKLVIFLTLLISYLLPEICLANKELVKISAENKPSEVVLVRLHLATDVSGTFQSNDGQTIDSSGDVGLHAGINLKFPGEIELSFFTGPEFSLNIPIQNPFAKTWMAGIEIGGPIAEPLRWVLEGNIAWSWYQRKTFEPGSPPILWSPDTTLKLVGGFEITLFEGKRTDIALQAKCGISPNWSTGVWQMAGSCGGAIHANF